MKREEIIKLVCFHEQEQCRSIKELSEEAKTKIMELHEKGLKVNEIAEYLERIGLIVIV